MAVSAFALVFGIGQGILSSLLRPRKKDTWNFGPRLSDLSIPTVSPGNEIQRIWGTIKVPAQVIYTSQLIETMHVASQKAAGGKGGKHQPTTYTISYTYAVHLALGICRGPIAQVNRIWAQGKLLWTNPALTAAMTQEAFDAAYMSEGSRLLDLAVPYEEASVSAYVFAYNQYEDPATIGMFTYSSAYNYILSHPLTPGYPLNSGLLLQMLMQVYDPVSWDKKYVPTKVRFDSLAIYEGTEMQEPDATLQGAIGAANVPAYRGLAYFVINNLQLADFGNTIPSFTVEVCKDGDITYETITTANYSSMLPYQGTEAGLDTGWFLLASGYKVAPLSSTVKLVTSTNVQLSQIIQDILTEAGMPVDSFDATTDIPADILVPGYAITQTASARQLLQDLQKVFAFDGTESGWRIKFNMLNQRMVTVLDPGDFGAHQAGDDLPASVTRSRMSELDMPRRINLKYQEPARNYSQNTVWAERQTGNSLSVEDMELPIAMDRAVAKTMVEQSLVYRFLSRNTYKVTLPRKYIILEPGDVVGVPIKGYTNEYEAWRVEEMVIGANGMIEFTFCDSDFTDGDLGAITGTDIGVTPPTVPVNSRTYVYMLDTPLLNDNIPDVPQFFVVLSGVTPGWKAGGLLVDLSDAGSVAAFGEAGQAPTSGSSWYGVAEGNVRVPHGFALQTLDPTVKSGSWDYKSEVLVYLIDNTWKLVNADPVDMMTQALNTCFIGGEVCAFANAEDLGNGNWRLTNWLRGLRGTEYAIPNHTGTELFVRLNSDAVESVSVTQDAFGKPATYVALSSGEVIGDEPTFSFTATGNSLRPYAPAITNSYKDESGNFTVLWQPRNRINGSWQSGADIALDQTTEAYEIDVVTLDAHGNDVVHKTYSFGAVRQWTYTATAQVADTGGTTGIFLVLYQIGNIIGRGFPSRIGV